MAATANKDWSAVSVTVAGRYWWDDWQGILSLVCCNQRGVDTFLCGVRLSAGESYGFFKVVGLVTFCCVGKSEWIQLLPCGTLGNKLCQWKFNTLVLVGGPPVVGPTRENLLRMNKRSHQVTNFRKSPSSNMAGPRFTISQMDNCWSCEYMITNWFNFIFKINYN